MTLSSQWENRDFFLQFPEEMLSKWRGLNADFFARHPEARVQEWFLTAHRIVQELKQGRRVGLVAVTGGGKNIIAYLVLLASNCRALFTVPQVVMASQVGHLEIFGILGNLVPILSITGSTPPQKRQWNDMSVKLILATPDVAAIEYRNGFLKPEWFDLLVVDELQHSAKPPYKTLAQAFKDVPVLGMSASPYETEPQQDYVYSLWHFDPWLKPDIIMPEKFVDTVYAISSPELDRCRQLCMELLDKQLTELKRNCQYLERYCNLPKGVVNPFGIGQTELVGMNCKPLTVELLDQVQGFLAAAKEAWGFGPPELSEAFKHYAHYRQTTRMAQLLHRGSFGAFLKYIQQLSERESENTKILLGRRAVAELVALAKSSAHPKVEQLKVVVRECVKSNRRGLIFVNEKSVGDDLAQQHLGDLPEGFGVEIIYGGADRNLKHSEATLNRLAQNQLGFVVCTDVLSEGVTVPTVDVVILYAVPSRVIKWIQQKGRTGRLRSGRVVVILGSNHDEAAYYRLLKKQRVAEELVGQSLATSVPSFGQELATIRPPVKGRKNKPDELTLPLFS